LPKKSGSPSVAAPVSVQGLHQRTVRSVTAPTAEDLDLAKEDALLQLRIGRSAHYYTVLVSAALALDGFLVLFFPPPLDPNSWTLANLLFLIFPIASGVFLAVFGLRIKWEEYQLWPWETHFWTTILAVLLNGVVGYLYLAGLFDFGPTGSWPLVPGLLPLAMGGLSAAMVGLALTWTSHSQRQLASLVSSLLPVPFAFVLYLPGLSHSARVSALAFTLLACAIFYQTSGSLLHLISSGTRAHERELITSGQTRMFVVADELRRKEDSLQLREAAALQRAAELEDNEISLKARLASGEETRAHLTRMEEELRARSDSLAEEQKRWAEKAASANAAARAAEDKENALQLREQALLDRLPTLAAREQQLVVKEGEVARRDVELARAQEENARRLQTIRDGESRLEARRSEVERRTADLLRQEAQLRTRETMVSASDQERSTASQRILDLESREARLNQLQITLDDLQGALGRQANEHTAMAASFAAREERHALAEAALVSRATALEQREAESGSMLRLSESKRLQYEEGLRAIEGRSTEEDGRTRSLEQLRAELQRRERDAADKEAQMVQRERLLTERETVLSRRDRELRERSRALVATSAARADGVEAETANPAPPEPFLASGTPGRRLPDRVSTGSPRLDDLLLGGIPSRGHVLLVGPPYTGKEMLLYQFVGEGLRSGQPVILIAGGRPPREVAEALSGVFPDFPERERRGQVLWIDASASSPSTPPTDADSGSRIVLAGAGGPTALLTALVQSANKADAMRPGGFRVATLGLAHLFHDLDPGKGAVFFQNFVGILKPREAVAVYALDSGLLPEALMGSLQSRADGVIEFREEREKRFLAVRGLGDVETRDWIEYRSTAQGLVIGSFALERIR
jgi:KaiC/GvpD/RAD55 family RecA-like ATPase